MATTKIWSIRGDVGHVLRYVQDENKTEPGRQPDTLDAVLSYVGRGDKTDARQYSYTVVDGEVYYRQNSLMSKPALNATATERVKGLVGLRDCLRSLIDLQMDAMATDEQIHAAQTELNMLYDDFSAKYGLINSRANALAFQDDSSYYLLCTLEELDEEKQLKSKADIFTKRTIKPHEVVTSVDTPSEALALSISEKAQVDLAYMSELTGNGLILLCQYVFGFVFVTLDAISENNDSRRKPVTSGNREAGEYPYYGASGIVDYVSSYIFDGDYLLVSEDGNNLVARSTPIAFSIAGKNWVNNHAHVLKFDCYATRRYVEFYLNSIDLSQYISGGAQPKLNQKNLNSIPIPLPSIKEQERIVGILDRFDALCNDISSGLPAEIEARQKQYEYYRDKLLTFKEQ